MTKPTVKGGLAPANAVDVKGRGSAGYNAARNRFGVLLCSSGQGPLTENVVELAFGNEIDRISISQGV